MGRRLGRKIKRRSRPCPIAPGPSPEKCRAQRLQDAFKSFAEKTKTWQPLDLDPVQQPNQPLLLGKGGYHDYESIRPDLLGCVIYICRYLRYIDKVI